MNKFYFLLLLISSNIYAEFISIGTGGITGTYYVTGSKICDFVNKIKKETKLRCLVESTAGSVYNINAIKENELDFAIIQNDVIYNASMGLNQYKNNKITNLKAVMAIYPELFTLVTREDANINSYNDLKGKRINLGNSNSGNEATTLAMFKAIGLKKSDLKLASSLNSIEMPDALRDNKIDAYFYMVGHPTKNIIDAANSTNVHIAPLKGKEIDELIKNNPYFIKGYIDANLYKNNNKKIQTFGVKAILVVNENISEKNVYILVKSILENFEEFKKSHQAYLNISKKSLIQGISIPLHNGAIKYYKEIGLIK